MISRGKNMNQSGDVSKRRSLEELTLLDGHGLRLKKKFFCCSEML